jgi:FlaA1/EpsC-like NDP-sugar epimerase
MPVTVTHPEMTRYFMSIPEATQLVLQAGSIAANGAIYILDMGEPVKIVDLARDLIRLSGLDAEADIPIQFTGVRPGEKLHEELTNDEETTESSGHEKILVVYPRQLPDQFDHHLEALVECAQAGIPQDIPALIKALIPDFNPPDGAQGYAY